MFRVVVIKNTAIRVLCVDLSLITLLSLHTRMALCKMNHKVFKRGEELKAHSQMLEFKDCCLNVSV